MRRFSFIFLLLISITSCSVEPKEINFGSDVCHFCKMTIVDKPFAAEVVNSKGKAFVYDAIECMVNNTLADPLDASLFLVYDYINPSEFIDATNAYFVISNKVKSPMGGNLAAFKNKSDADKFISANTGILLNWTELNSYLKLNEK